MPLKVELHSVSSWTCIHPEERKGGKEIKVSRFKNGGGENSDIWLNMDEPRAYNARGDKPGTETGTTWTHLWIFLKVELRLE